MTPLAETRAMSSKKSSNALSGNSHYNVKVSSVSSVLTRQTGRDIISKNVAKTPWKTGPNSHISVIFRCQWTLGVREGGVKNFFKCWLDPRFLKFYVYTILSPARSSFLSSFLIHGVNQCCKNVRSTLERDCSSGGRATADTNYQLLYLIYMSILGSDQLTQGLLSCVLKNQYFYYPLKSPKCHAHKNSRGVNAKWWTTPVAAGKRKLEQALGKQLVGFLSESASIYLGEWWWIKCR